MRLAQCATCVNRVRPLARDEVLMQGHGYIGCKVGRPGVYTAAQHWHRCETYQPEPPMPAQLGLQLEEVIAS